MKPLKKKVCPHCKKEFIQYNSLDKFCSYKCKSENSKKSIKVVKVKKPLKKKYPKATGEAKVFKQIWIERPHFCEHCGNGLPEPPLAIYFSHDIRKSKENSQRLNPKNIRLHCELCHVAKDQGTEEEYMKRKRINTDE